ncbi:MAG: rod shape-determining protein MreD [Legionellaceae bacterium]|nr:rod shape-determining protein MreD [Legionellaceae bacterium]
MSTNGRILLVLLGVMLLTIMPLPYLANVLRPPLLVMFWFYIRIFMPERFTFLGLMLTGCLLDVLIYTIIGQHGFAMASSLWLLNTRARRLVFFNIFQQMIPVFLLTMVYLYLMAGVNAFTGHPVRWWQPLLVASVSTLLWPWFKLTLDDLLMKRKISAS